MDNFNVYSDIKARTGGEIYIGVVGPVRTGKSTFIKRFMELMVLPGMEDTHARERTRDELPQSSAGKTIMTTEPKFIPKEAARISLGEGIDVKIRLIDCVGFMVEGAAGHIENDAERQVKTPWFDTEIPFTEAAELGTRKVITDHSTIGLVITTDGSFGEIKRNSYIPAEEKTVKELKNLNKPFLILLNSLRPYSEETKKLAYQMEEKYGVQVVPVNCEQLKRDDINQILESVLYEFPVTMIEFYMPKWVEMLPNTHKLKADLIEKIRAMMNGIDTIRDVIQKQISVDSVYIKRCIVENINMADGSVRVVLDVDDKYYYEMLSDLVGETIGGEYQLIILDEINICVAMNMIKVSDVKEVLMNKPESLEIVLTGRYAHPELVAMAHLVTEMKPIKHYFDMGVMARQGIEY